MTTSYGLSASGFTAARQADYLTIIRGLFEQELVALGFTQMPDWDRDVFLGQITEIMAYLLGQQSEALQAVYDARSLANATGIHLANLCLLVGVTKLAATYSTTTLTCAGTNGTVITQGKIVEGGGDDGAARWIITSDGTISGGTCTVTARAENKGEITAIVGEIDAIVTPVAGWTSVTNAAVPTPGRDEESPAALRARRQARLAAAGSTSCAAILAALLAEGTTVTGAIVLDNKTGSTVTTQGVSIDPYAVACVVAPSSATPALVAAAIYSKLGGGTRTSGSESGTVTKRDGRSETIKWYLAASAPVAIVWVLAMAPGYVAADVEDALVALVEDYFLTLGPGDTVYPSALIALAMTITGIKNVTTLTLDGGATPVAMDADEIPTIGSQSVS